MNASGRVLFVDVGQGSCQVILLGNQKAIVIDAGCSPELPLRLLEFFKIQSIEVLVISHGHHDHSGGMARSRKKNWRKGDPIAGVLVHYRGAIGKVSYVSDSQFHKRPVGQYLIQLINEGVLTREQLDPFVANAKPYELWSSDDSETQLVAISPLGGHHLQALAESTPNSSSAILELRHRGERVVFSADSEYQQWRDIYRLRGESPLNCKALTLPHHGGLMDGSQSDLEWFASTAVNAEVVVVSVATRNAHEHPRPEAIKAFSSRNAHVMCTQITEQCCSDLESLRPAVIGSLRFPCKSSSKTLKIGKKNKRSAHVACAGTISALMQSDGFAIENRAEHRSSVDRMQQAANCPLCRSMQDSTTKEIDL